MRASELRADRLNRGRNIRQQAAEIGVAPHVLKHTERGGRPTPENAKLIADFYGVQVTDIWPVAEPERIAS